MESHSKVLALGAGVRGVGVGGYRLVPRDEKCGRTAGMIDVGESEWRRGGGGEGVGLGRGLDVLLGIMCEILYQLPSSVIEWAGFPCTCGYGAVGGLSWVYSAIGTFILYCTLLAWSGWFLV